jgi:hypothetical protein
MTLAAGEGMGSQVRVSVKLIVFAEWNVEPISQQLAGLKVEERWKAHLSRQLAVRTRNLMASVDVVAVAPLADSTLTTLQANARPMQQQMLLQMKLALVIQQRSHCSCVLTDIQPCSERLVAKNY